MRSLDLHLELIGGRQQTQPLLQPLSSSLRRASARDTYTIWSSMLGSELPATLIAITGPAAGETFRVDTEEAVIGRDDTNSLAVPDPSISRRHCIVRRSGSDWTVQDLGSFNGTFVNGQPVTEAALRDGDRVRTGETEFLFRCHAPHAEGTPAEARRDTTRLQISASRYLQQGALDQPDSRIQRELQVLVRLGTTVNGLRDRRGVETELLRCAFEVVPATQAAFLRAEVGTPDFACVGLLARAGYAAPRLDSTITGLAVTRREAVLSKPHVVSAEGSAQRPQEPHPESLLVVPVCSDREVTGLLYLTTGDSPHLFDQLHLELVTAIAGIGSVALQSVQRVETLQAETERLKKALNITHEMKGDSPAMQRVYGTIAKVAPTDATVLVSGETGTGKELVARAIHSNSTRASRPFVAINCAAIAETLLESELFGHERGAFSGAVAMKRGHLEVASGGTLFLDEVAELSPALQAKLLRVLQQREFQRVGGTRTIPVDIRLIAATNRQLEKEVRAGRFRDDLLYRLKVVEMEMPPLRKRRRDLPVLIAHFLERAAEKYGRRAVAVSPAAERCLAAYDWPGNVRELENAIDRAVIMSSSAELAPEDLPEGIVERAAIAGTTQPSSFHDAVLETKKRVILEALEETGGQITEAARLLGLHPNYLHRLLTGLGLRPGAEEGAPPAGRPDQ